jgi:hypothetical protein
MLDAMLAKSKEKIWKIVQFEVRFVSCLQPARRTLAVSCVTHGAPRNDPLQGGVRVWVPMRRCRLECWRKGYAGDGSTRPPVGPIIQSSNGTAHLRRGLAHICARSTCCARQARAKSRLRGCYLASTQTRLGAYSALHVPYKSLSASVYCRDFNPQC